ncbi:GDP-mannose 4,6-dehydratase [Bacillus kexueae]|uniref:GDP-mannose 4,6-dehydratase n=1 Tax=Aeribacillus kexueae TaxID=2078952 RepID=UPI001FAFA897|nr:NAD-dependent epimerase/dehydratase family protein [Bacillus kexueae]
MKVIITGGAGFIGSHVSRSLIEKGHEVLIVDNLHPYYRRERKQMHLDYIKRSGDFQFHKADIRDEKKLEEIFNNFQPEAVIHFAALPGVRNSILQPIEYIDFDINGTVQVLKAAGKIGAKHVLFASSSSVYGDQVKRAVKEEMADGKVISPYAAAKFGAESFCHAYEHLYGYTVSIIRFFTVYGPWGRPDMAIQKFIKKAIVGDKIELYDLQSARDYTYIDDAVEGVLRILFYNKQSNIFNIGTGHPIELVTVIEELNKYFPALRFSTSTPQVGDVNWTWADISNAQHIVGYEPKIAFQEGLKRTVEWAKSNVRAL